MFKFRENKDAFGMAGTINLEFNVVDTRVVGKAEFEIINPQGWKFTLRGQISGSCTQDGQIVFNSSPIKGKYSGAEYQIVIGGTGKRTIGVVNCTMTYTMTSLHVDNNVIINESG
jgi:hypothetical protein